MGHFHYGRHFSMLAAGVVVVFLVTRWDLFSEPFLPTFAISGAVHASALVFALRAPQVRWRKCLFIAIAAALSVMSVMTFYIGILALQLLAVLTASERLYMVLGICAVSGAITYGALIRLFWMKQFSSRSLLAIAVACVPATIAAFFVRGYFQFLEGWWLAAAWWFAFSSGLWYFDTHADSRARPAGTLQR
jgi:hypothetical protein